MKKLISIFTLALLTITFTSAVPRNEEQKNEDKTTSGVAVKTAPNIDMEEDSQSMDEDDSKNVNLMAVMNECNDTFVIPTSYIQSLNENGSFPDETDRNPKCYVRCVLEKTGVASEEGVFKPARAAVVFAGQRGGRPMDDLETMAIECGNNRVEPCKCERSYQYLKCLMEMEIQRYEKLNPQVQNRMA